MFNYEKFRSILLNKLMYSYSQTKQLQDLNGSVLHFVNIEIPLETRHLRANQSPYITKELSKAVMTRSRWKNIFSDLVD